MNIVDVIGGGIWRKLKEKASEEEKRSPAKYQVPSAKYQKYPIGKKQVWTAVIKISMRCNLYRGIVIESKLEGWAGGVLRGCLGGV